MSAGAPGSVLIVRCVIFQWIHRNILSACYCRCVVHNSSTATNVEAHLFLYSIFITACALLLWTGGTIRDSLSSDDNKNMMTRGRFCIDATEQGTSRFINSKHLVITSDISLLRRDLNNVIDSWRIICIPRLFLLSDFCIVMRLWNYCCDLTNLTNKENFQPFLYIRTMNKFLFFDKINTLFKV